MQQGDSIEGIPGYKALLAAYSHPDSRLYIKISGAYRLTSTPDLSNPQVGILRQIFVDLVNISPNRLVFASDWPHTRFEGIDTIGWMKEILAWCWECGMSKGDENKGKELIGKIFKRNADELWLGRG